MNIEIKNKEGIILKTGKKYVAEDVTITLSEEIVGTTGLPIEVATAEEMNAKLIEENVGLVFKYVGTSTEEFENGAMYVIEAGE